MIKISPAIFCSLLSFSPLLTAQVGTETASTPIDNIVETPAEIIQSENKPYVQKPIIIENSNAVMSVPLKATNPISAATPLKAVVNKPAMNIKMVIHNELINSKIPLAPVMTKYNHLLPMPIGAVSKKPLLDVTIITENSNAEQNSPIKSVSNQIFNDIPVIIECSYSMINTPINPEIDKQKRNPPLIQKIYPTDFFPDTLYVLNIPTNEPQICFTPVSCIPVSFHQHWCSRYPGECEKNLEKRKKIYESWCKKNPLKCKEESTALKDTI